jgi:hypothetical protein
MGTKIFYGAVFVKAKNLCGISIFHTFALPKFWPKNILTSGIHA